MSKEIKLELLYNKHAAGKNSKTGPVKIEFAEIIEALADYLEKREDMSPTDLRSKDKQASGVLRTFDFFSSGEVGRNQQGFYPGKNDNEKGVSAYVTLAMDAFRTNTPAHPEILKKLQEFKPD